MRAREFLSESRRIISEILMKTSGDNDWAKSKYYEPFIEGIHDGMIYAFGIKAKKGTKKAPAVAERNFSGRILDPGNLERQLRYAIKRGTYNDVRFDVEVYDEDRGEFSGEIVRELGLGNVWKDEKITGNLKVNMGNVSEAILGSAVAAKFISGGAQVTEAQVIRIAQQLAENKGYIETTTTSKDKLVFKVTIPFMDKKAFYAWVGRDSRNKTLKDYGIKDETIKLFDQRLKAAVEYANNSKRVLSAVGIAQQDPKQNKVDVLSDGGEKENQNTTKVDLKILIDGQETAKRLLSVKAGNVAQFGQVGGHNFEDLNEFFTSSLGISISPSLKKYFYDVPPGTRGAQDQKEHNYDNGFPLSYDNVLKQLKSKANADEMGLVQDIYKGLMYHLTRNEEGVEMVILDPDGKKAFSELSFGPEFKQALDQLKIYAIATGGEKGHGMAIYGFPQGAVAKRYVPSDRSDAGSKLVELRSQLTKTYNVRNRLGMGGLLKHIADIENYIEKAPAQQPVQAPTAKPVKPSAVGQIKPTPTQKQVPTTPGIANLSKSPVNKIPMGQEPETP